MSATRSTALKRPIVLRPDDEPRHAPGAILHAKLQQPRQLPGTVARPRLWSELDRGAQRAILLVAAPAGFGKTTLVSSWLHSRATEGERPLRVVWMSLDRGDSDLIVFLRYLCAALESLFPNTCSDLRAMVNGPVTPPPHDIATRFSNAVYDVPDDFVLVLDDFHLVEGEDVPGLFTALAPHWPAHLHLVLISRHLPNLPLATLRARGQLTELVADDLRFNPAEIREYLHRMTESDPDPQTTEHYATQTEGWIAGLHLAALTEKRIGAPPRARARYVANANLSEYLIEDVLAHENPAILEFLLAVSILDRLCLPLCEALAEPLPGQMTSRECLDWLVDSNFFIVPLDESGEWYRLHRLLKDALRQHAARRLGDAQLAAWRRRAVSWFEQHGMLEEALQQAIALNDLDLAAHLVEIGFAEALDREDRATLDRWLKLFPEPFIAQRPGLLMLKATTMQMAWRLRLMSQTLDQFDALSVRSPSPPMAGNLNALRGMALAYRAQLAYFQNQMAASLAFASEALERLPADWEFGRGGALIYLATALQALGRYPEAEAVVMADLAPVVAHARTYVLRLLMALTASAVNEGLLERAHKWVSVMLDRSLIGEFYLMRSWALYWSGVVDFEWGRSSAARDHFAALAELRLVAHSHAVRNGLIGLAVLQAEQGQPTDAQQTLLMLSQYDVTLQGVETAEVSALRAWLAALDGDWPTAGRWADTWHVPVPDAPLIWLLDPHLVKARILVQRRRPADLREADAILTALAQIARDTHNVRYRVYLGVARALHRDATGNVEDARQILIETVRLAEPGGFVRAFAESGHRLRELLTQIARAEPRNSAVYGLLRDIAHANAQRTQRPARSVRQPLAEPLTLRELDVLRLMRQRLSDKEIAATLNISVGTVKRHSANLFVKLDVNRRWEAVVRAEELAIL